ncbi:MAG: PIG-L family deacetylase [Aquabacterium sp.]
MVILSPHLDDAVFSCGHLLATHAGSTVVTVFAGMPGDPDLLCDWDAHCGFHSSQEAVTARRQEDRQALALLAARPVWLDFLDSQYGHSPSPRELADALQQTLSELDPYELAIPLGMFHADHLLVHEAALLAIEGLPQLEQVYLYEDVPYRGQPGLLQQRLSALATEGLLATPQAEETLQPSSRKAAAVAAYASQVRALGPRSLDDLRRPERLWRLEPPLHARSGPVIEPLLQREPRWTPMRA